MILENACYLRDMLMILRMVRAGLFGELVHCAGGYQHDLRLLSSSGSDNFTAEGQLTWRGEELARRNGNLYPTHPVGPIAQYLNINRGDRFATLVSMSSKSRGMNHWARKNLGPEHPGSRRPYAEGDVNMTLLNTENGCTVALYHDTQSPRPYDLAIRVQGTEAIYMQSFNSIYVEGRSPAKDAWESIEHYRKDYEHPLWAETGEIATKYSHGGSDYIELVLFVKAVRDRTPVPLDVYDAATWSAISPLSEISVAQGSAPVAFPDFTVGKWQSRKTVA